ncbi:MAG: GspE/PulE family protein [Aminobacteriaceae bacterium]|nr:type II secretion system protein GspE [Synergistales bacterium]
MAPRLPDVEEIAPLIRGRVSLDALKNAGILPLRDDGERLVVALASPECFPAAQVLAASFGREATWEFHRREDLEHLLGRLYDLRGGIGDETLSAVAGIDDDDGLLREDVQSDSVDVPVIRLVNGLLREALKIRATDIHVEPFESEVLVRFRVDGVLHDRLRLPRNLQAPLTSRVKVMARMDIAERLSPQDGRIGITVGNRAVDIRVSSIPVQHGERLALRLLDKGSGLLSLEDLGMDGSSRETMNALIGNPHGLILFTGPTGSGKTTTLYAILQALAKPEVNIITVEDPIEYDLEGVGQIQVNEKAGVTFPSALRSILRQDPDIIMIGEMRDYETAHIGVQASLTGHLVLSTLHTNDSVSAVVRLTDMGIEPYLAAGSLLGAVAQRLVRTLCPKCSYREEAPALFRREGLTEVFRGRGCDSCMGTGYRGRVGLYEQFILDDELREMVAAGLPTAKIRAAARMKGFRSLWELGLHALRQGRTSPEELLRVVSAGEFGPTGEEG